MKVFRPDTADDAEWLALTRENDYDLPQSLSPGSPAGDAWRPLECELYADEPSHKRVRSQLPWFTSGFVALRDEAIGTVGQLLEPFGELLPVRCRDAEVVVFRPLRTIDALDVDKTEIDWLEPGKRAMYIEHPLFTPGVLGEREIFLMPQTRNGIYATEGLVREIEAFGYHGTEFRYLSETIPKDE